MCHFTDLNIERIEAAPDAYDELVAMLANPGRAPAALAALLTGGTDETATDAEPRVS